MDSLSEEYMDPTANIHPPNDADLSELFDPVSLPEDQRVAFYGSMLAMAAADGIWGQDELDLIFQHVNTDGLSERSRNKIWDGLVATPPLTDCLAWFASSHDQVRCTLMVYLIDIALADRILDAREDEALLQARQCLHISPTQIHAIERYICERGLIRARPRDYHQAAAWLKYSISITAALSIPAAVIYFSSTAGGVSLPERLMRFAPPHSVLAMVLGVGGAMLIAMAVFLTGRWLYGRYQRKRLTIARERHRQAQLALRNLQDAVGYLATKTAQLAPVEMPNAPTTAPSDAVVERLTILQQMLARRQASAAAVSSCR
jgi:uncharacterized tellurite resistance protein B-like protein